MRDVEMPVTSTPPVWFSVPELAVALDLGDDSARRAAALAANTPDSAPEDRLPLFLAQEAVVERLRAGGAVYAAHLLGTVDGRPTVALFAVLVTAVRLGNDAVLESIGNHLAVEDASRVVEYAKLPCGSATILVEDRTVGSTTVRQLQLLVPFPDRRHLATFTLSTEYLQDWQGYLGLMAEVATNVSFGAPEDIPGRPSGIAAALSGGV